MYIGVISDTHGNVQLVQKAMILFREFEVVRILHCGDIGSEGVVRQFRGVPTEFVLGNCDGAGVKLREVIEAEGQICHGVFGRLTLEGKDIAFMHGHDTLRFEREAKSGRWDMLCYGHTHEAALWMGCEHTIVMNPGALERAKTPSVAVVKLPELDVTRINIAKF